MSRGILPSDMRLGNYEIQSFEYKYDFDQVKNENSKLTSIEYQFIYFGVFFSGL